MAKYIDKDALVAEIERLKERFIAFHHRDGNDCPLDNYGKIRAYNEVLSFIDSLPEEPVSESLKDEIAKFNDNYFPETDNGLNIEMRNELRTIVGVAAKMSAQWQKEQMLKDAVSGAYIRRNKYTKTNVLNGFNVTCDVVQKFKDKDNVKVIIIKDE
jgi:hypothetical protein